MIKQSVPMTNIEQYEQLKLNFNFNEFLTKYLDLILSSFNFIYPKPEEVFNVERAHPALQSVQHILKPTTEFIKSLIETSDNKYQKSIYKTIINITNRIDKNIDGCYPNNTFQVDRSHMKIQIMYAYICSLEDLKPIIESNFDKNINIDFVKSFDLLSKFNTAINYAYPKNNYSEGHGHTACQGIMKKTQLLKIFIDSLEQNINSKIITFFEIFKNELPMIESSILTSYPNNNFKAHMGHQAIQLANEHIKLLKKIVEDKKNIFNENSIQTEENLEKVDIKPKIKFQL
jgi:hypothetical protein